MVPLMSHIPSSNAPGADPRLAAARLRKLCSLRPTLAIVLGSGFDDTLPGVRVALDVRTRSCRAFPEPPSPATRGNCALD